MRGAVRFKQAKVPKQPGELARLKVVAGPDFGAIFVIGAQKVSIGRGETSDVMISDLKASRLHCELSQSAPGGAWALRDLGSANGIRFQGRETRATPLRSGETFAIGETTLEFAAAESGTQVLIAPPKTSTQVFVDQQYQQVHQQRLRAMTTMGGVRGPGMPNGGVSAASLQFGNPRTRMILIVLALVLGASFFFEEEQQNVKRAARKPGAGAPAVRALAQYSNVDLPDDVKKKAEMFFKAGFREYQEENYLRAITQFNTVLDLTNQGHALALAYRDNALREIDKQMDKLLERGRKAKAAGRLRESKGMYQAVLRMNFGGSSDPKIIEAEEQLKEIQKLEKKEEVGEL
jgi:hypothetical protein